MKPASRFSALVLILVCLAVVGGCGQSKRAMDAEGTSKSEIVPYTHDNFGRAYYHDASGRSYYKDLRGERHYAEPAAEVSVSSVNRSYRVEESPIHYYIGVNGRRYVLDEKGARHYVGNVVDMIYVDDMGNRYYLDSSGVKHMIGYNGPGRYMTDASGRRYYVDSYGNRTYVGDVFRRYFVDMSGRKYYTVNRYGNYIVDEAGEGYYVIPSTGGGAAAMVQIIRVPQMTVTPREAVMLGCNKTWNACFLSCNQKNTKQAKENCLNRCDDELDRCMGRE